MGELLKILLDLAKELLPFRVVWQWQMGLYFVAGRYWATVWPGLKLVVPYLCDVRLVPMAPEIEVTPLQTVTLRDGKTLTYSASLTIRVTDAAQAYMAVGHWGETIVELASGILSASLAEADVLRIVDPSRGKRDNLLEEIREEINSEAAKFGVEVAGIRLNNFALGVRAIRLMLDAGVQKQRHYAGVLP